MPYDSWRGTVGIIKPTLRPGSIEELARILPDGIGMALTHIDITTGSQTEFESVIPHYEERVVRLAKAEVDVISPRRRRRLFFLLGDMKASRSCCAAGKSMGMAARYSPTERRQVNALNAFKAKSFVGASYFPDKEINKGFARYFQGAELRRKVREMQGMEIAFDKGFRRALEP